MDLQSHFLLSLQIFKSCVVVSKSCNKDSTKGMDSGTNRAREVALDAVVYLTSTSLINALLRFQARFSGVWRLYADSATSN